MKKKGILLMLFILCGLCLLLGSCKTQEVPGRRRAPRHCNTCTKWSYVPQTTEAYESPSA